jgi:flagellar motor switch protein FliM
MATTSPIQSVAAQALPTQAVSGAHVSMPGTSSLMVAATDGAQGGDVQRDTPMHDEFQPLRLLPSFARLPVSLAVTVPVRAFRVRDLLAIATGEVIETQWSYGEDLPLSSGDVQLAWSEFEVVETRLAVRVTRLA